MQVIYFHRKPRVKSNFSIEFYFEKIRHNLPKEIEWRVEQAKYESNGILKRLYMIFDAYRKQGQINHVTGDVNFINYLFNKEKTVLTILDCGFMNTSSGIRRYLLKTFWLTFPVMKSKIITVISQATKDELLKFVKCDPDKIRVVPVFVSEAFKPGEEKLFNSEKPVLLQIGTKPNKNILRLIEAIKDIPCVLDIVGELTPEYIQALERHNIDYINSVRISNEEIVEKYKNCDIVTFVSTYEGFGMPIIEANSVNKPVITSNILSMPEVAGDAACLVDPFDVNQIRKGIQKIIKDVQYRNKLIENGKKNKLRYLPDSIVQMYIDIYKEVLH